MRPDGKSGGIAEGLGVPMRGVGAVTGVELDERHQPLALFFGGVEGLVQPVPRGIIGHADVITRLRNGPGRPDLIHR